MKQNSSTDVYNIAKEALKDRSKGDVFVMWDPEVTKAVEKLGYKKLWGSDKFSGYIIDVFVFHQDYILNNEKEVKNFLSTYFRTLNYYNNHRDDMVNEFMKLTSSKKTDTESMINNIDWYDLQQNCTDMFDIQTNVAIPSKDGIINSIYACADVMNRVGTMTESVDDPYLLINSHFLEDINTSQLKNVGANSKDDFVFEHINDSEWSKLNTIGTMRVQDITFQSGTSHLDYNGKHIVDQVANMLINNYPNYRIEIQGHSSKGDNNANMKLSQERAEIVKQRLIAVHNIDENRVLAKGYGHNKPPKKKKRENPRAYRLRWARVEFILLSDDRL